MLMLIHHPLIFMTFKRPILDTSIISSSSGGGGSDKPKDYVSSLFPRVCVWPPFSFLVALSADVWRRSGKKT